MKITMDIIDNGMRIVHAKYDKADIETVKKRCEEELAKKQEEKQS